MIVQNTVPSNKHRAISAEDVTEPATTTELAAFLSSMGAGITIQFPQDAHEATALLNIPCRNGASYVHPIAWGKRISYEDLSTLASHLAPHLHDLIDHYNSNRPQYAALTIMILTALRDARTTRLDLNDWHELNEAIASAHRHTHLTPKRVVA